MLSLDRIIPTGKRCVGVHFMPMSFPELDGKKVLGVSTDARMIRLMEVALRREGCLVHVVSETDALLELARSEGEKEENNQEGFFWPPLAVVVDCPAQDDLELEVLRILRTEPRLDGIPLIATSQKRLSRHYSIWDPYQYRYLPFAPVTPLLKPFNPLELLLLLRRAVQLPSESDEVAGE